MADKALVRERTYEELAIEEPENHPVRWGALRLSRREDGALILRGRGVGQSITLSPEAAREFAKQVKEAVGDAAGKPLGFLNIPKESADSSPRQTWPRIGPPYIELQSKDDSGGATLYGRYVCATGDPVVPNGMAVEED